MFATALEDGEIRENAWTDDAGNVALDLPGHTGGTRVAFYPARSSRPVYRVSPKPPPRGATPSGG